MAKHLTDDEVEKLLEDDVSNSDQDDADSDLDEFIGSIYRNFIGIRKIML